MRGNACGMISFAIALAAAAVAEQMAPAQKGMLQCQMPDMLFKTCASLTKVVASGPEAYRLETSLLVNPTGPVVATVTSNVAVQGNAICDKNDPADIDAAAVMIGGKPAPAAEAARHIATLKRTLATFARKTVCTEVVAGEGGTLKVQGRVNGTRIPLLDYDMIWVNPADGWTVAR
jgi:hypothetical protein